MSFNQNATTWNPKEYLKSKYLRVEDVSQPMIVTVQASGERTFQSGETKPVIRFLELNQELVLNKTRTGQAVQILGGNPAEWQGKKVMLAPGTFNGVNTIMIQPVPAQQIQNGHAPGETAIPVKPEAQVEPNGDVIFA